jgi:hypothetical protein
MLRIKFRDCCKDCQYRESYLDENKMFNGKNEISGVMTVIGCKHEQVCEKYNRNEKAPVEENVENKKKGQPIRVILYKGDSIEEAYKISNEVAQCWRDNKPYDLPNPFLYPWFLPKLDLNGSTPIKLLDFNLVANPLSCDKRETYTVEVKGEIV